MVLFSKLRKMPKNVSFFCLLSIYCTYVFYNKTICTRIRNTLETFCTVLFIFLLKQPTKQLQLSHKKQSRKSFYPASDFLLSFSLTCLPTIKPYHVLPFFCKRCLFLMRFLQNGMQKRGFLLLFYSFLLKPVFAIRVSKNNKILDFKRSFLRVFLPFRVFL